MGLCHGKPSQIPEPEAEEAAAAAGLAVAGTASPGPAAAAAAAAGGKAGHAEAAEVPVLPCRARCRRRATRARRRTPSVASTPARGGLKRPFPPPSPAKHIRALLARRHGSVKPNEAPIPEGGETEVGLDKGFGFSKHFFAKYELGDEVGRGHFGYTCSAKAKKGDHKGHDVAVKVIPKAKVGFPPLPRLNRFFLLLEMEHMPLHLTKIIFPA
ncbi:hypothetical protein OsJ_31616 [Oryza sativa Japonica Group]|uniref:Protein kinase domain-containing protein n=1 Tax=Oryza sativa subsp. japonica TaxID=39947 RepID=A3C504_ORYSJ|nr:hypothetical protein OsJ_31616 [Oryza sativa Japonica Group]